MEWKNLGISADTVVPGRTFICDPATGGHIDVMDEQGSWRRATEQEAEEIREQANRGDTLGDDWNPASSG
jgi:hypothetical protein